MTNVELKREILAGASSELVEPILRMSGSGSSSRTWPSIREGANRPEAVWGHGG